MNKNNKSNLKKDNRAQFTARFGCGFIFGIFAAISLGQVVDAQTLVGLFAIILVSSVVCGLLSVAFGDKFWHWLASWL